MMMLRIEVTMAVSYTLEVMSMARVVSRVVQQQQELRWTVCKHALVGGRSRDLLGNTSSTVDILETRISSTSEPA